MTRTTRLQLAAVTVIAVLGTVLGWRALWFLTDDAFIAFRYVSNSQLGHGYTWNPPPFLPVEGYTSFLWVGLLDLVWGVFGIEPPRSANALSLGCSIGTVLICAGTVHRLGQRHAAGPRTAVVAGLSLALLVSNTTFLTWSSSGLETALFDLLLLAWVLAVPALATRRTLLPGVAVLAALLELCRPDGLLFAGVTLLVPAVLWLRGGRGPRAEPAHIPPSL